MNQLYRETSLLQDDSGGGFYWIDFSDLENTVVSYARHRDGKELVFVFNFTPVPRPDYKQGVPHVGAWQVKLSSDDLAFGGSGSRVLRKAGSATGHDSRAAGIDSTGSATLGLLILEKIADAPKVSKKKASS